MSAETFVVRSFKSGAVTAVDAVSGRSFARHIHDEYGVGLITGGAQRSWSGRGQVEAVSGNLITVNPGELHDGGPIGSHRSWSMLYFSQDAVSAVIADIKEGLHSLPEIETPVVDNQALAELFVVARQATMHQNRESAFEELILRLFGCLFQISQPVYRIPSQKISRIRELIDEDPSQPHTLTDLAALAGLSRYQTLRGFAQLTGLTPHAYATQRRLDIARLLIRKGQALADASIHAGFFDQSHMHRNFVARYGYTPGAYASAFPRARAISCKSVAPRLS